MPEPSMRTARLELRLTPEAERKLRAAALASGRSLGEFVLESALVRADETLEGRLRFSLDAERWLAFHEALDSPPRELPRLRRLLETPGIFESDSTA
jgi:uncharacterized protein (DUF1778 family)